MLWCGIAFMWKSLGGGLKETQETIIFFYVVRQDFVVF